MNEVREATLEDAQYISANLREADRAELSLGGKDPHKVILDAVRDSDSTFVGLHHGNPYFLGGVVETSLGNLVWACGTPEVSHNVSHLLSESSRIIDDWLVEYDLIQNVVWTGNQVHIRWLEHMGFQFGEDLAHNDTTYRYFYKGLNLCVPQEP